MQLSAFADTKVPLKLNPWSCSEFNRLHDTKRFLGGVRWGYSRSLLPRLGPSWEKSAWKHRHLCPHLLFVEKHHLWWKPLQPFSDYWKTGKGKCRQSLILPTQWCLVRASFGCKRTRIIHRCGAPLGLDLVFCTSLSCPPRVLWDPLISYLEICWREILCKCRLLH